MSHGYEILIHDLEIYNDVTVFSILRQKATIAI